MKVKAIAFANSVKAGASASEQMFLAAELDGKPVWDIEIVNSVYVKIEEVRSKNVVYTSLFNTKWWLPADGQEAPKKKAPAKKVAAKL